LKTKLPRYNDDDDVKECQYVWQENELATFDGGCWDSCCCWRGEGCGGKGLSNICGTALLLTYNAHPHMHTHNVPSGAYSQ